MRHITYLFILSLFLFCSCGSDASKSKITSQQAFQGVSQYCHEAYDWSVAQDNPSIMGLEMGPETDSTYHVVFHSYTGALVNFYVNKSSCITRIQEYVPALDITEESGSIDLSEYLEKKP